MALFPYREAFEHLRGAVDTLITAHERVSRGDQALLKEALVRLRHNT